MGYNLKIGEAKIHFDSEYAAVRIETDGFKNPDAPTFPNDTMTENTSWRFPSYTGWSEFCKESGLYPLFYGKGWDPVYRQNVTDEETIPWRERPILDHHPGVALIVFKDLDFIRKCLKQYKKTAPKKKPGFEGWNGEDADVYDPILARLIWLEYWFDYALKNCKVPVMTNS